MNRREDGAKYDEKAAPDFALFDHG